MTATLRPVRRPRRGSLERPVNGRLYRSAFLVLTLPLVILAFSVTRPTPLPAPVLPPNFDGAATATLAGDFAKLYPNRVPGSAGSLGAAGWFRDALRPYGLPVSSDSWHETVPGLGRVRLQNLWAVAAGQSTDAIVVMAHRDDVGTGPGANDDASGTAALVELARGYGQAGAPAAEQVRPSHTIVFLSTDGGAFGGLGAARFAAHLPFHVIATVNLTALAGPGPPRILITGDTPRSPAAPLVETASRRILEQTGTQPRRAGLLAQLVDLGFPATLYEQGPFVARGIPAVTLTTAGERPPAPFTDRATALRVDRLAAMGRSAQELVGSLDSGLDLTQGTTSFVWAGDRVIRGWAIELLLVALLVPCFVVAVDLFAHCRRRRISLLPAARSLRTRLAFWLFVGLSFLALGVLGTWPHGASRLPNPATPAAGDWSVLSLLLLGAIALVAWLVARQRLVPRRPVGADERLAGETSALIGLCIVSLLILATNPFALLFVLPAMHAWLWLPQVRSGRPPARAIFFLVGLVGPLLLLGSLATRFGLGFDAPWYLLELVALGYVKLPAVAITLAGVACAAQLATVATGRYAPYPDARERPARGPLRELVRRVVLAVRARRRRVAGERQRAIGG
jgi:hypothetical protein